MYANDSDDNWGRLCCVCMKVSATVKDLDGRWVCATCKPEIDALIRQRKFTPPGGDTDG